MVASIWLVSQPVRSYAAAIRRRCILRAACSSSWTSATPRPTSAPTTATSCVEHWRFATVRDVDRRRAGRGAAQPARAARPRPRPTCDGSIVSSTVPQLGPSGAQVGSRYLAPRDDRRRTGRRRPGCRSATTTRARSVPTAWSTPSPPTTRSAPRASCVDFGTAITFDPVSAEGEYLGGDHRPGRRDLDGGASTERGAALPKIDLVAAALGDRQVDGRRDPLRRRSTASRARSTGSSGACAPSSVTRPRPIATGGLAGRDRPLHRRRSTRSTTC